MIRDCTRDCGMCPAGLITRTCTSTWKTVHVALQHDTYVVHSTFTYYYHYRIDNVRSVIYVIVIGMSDFTTEHSALWTSKKIIDKLYSAFERERERELVVAHEVFVTKKIKVERIFHTGEDYQFWKIDDCLLLESLFGVHSIGRST